MGNERKMFSLDVCMDKVFSMKVTFRTTQWQIQYNTYSKFFFPLLLNERKKTANHIFFHCFMCVYLKRSKELNKPKIVEICAGRYFIQCVVYVMRNKKFLYHRSTTPVAYYITNQCVILVLQAKQAHFRYQIQKTRNL